MSSDVDEDWDDDSDDSWSDGEEWSYGDVVDTAPHRANLVGGGIVTVNEANGLPWVWSIAQREMRQRQTLTRTFGS